MSGANEGSIMVISHKFPVVSPSSSTINLSIPEQHAKLYDNYVINYYFTIALSFNKEPAPFALWPKWSRNYNVNVAHSIFLKR